MALTYTPSAPESFRLPSFSGQLVDGRNFESTNLSKYRFKVIAFICAHCPYVQAIESRLIELAHDLKALNGVFLGICSNDASEYPEDAPEALKKRAQEKGYNFDYLVDADQSIAKAFGAVCTPDFFVFDEKNELFYRGRLDDSWRDAGRVKNRELLQAIEKRNLKLATTEQIPSMGCSIKWKN